MTGTKRKIPTWKYFRTPMSLPIKRVETTAKEALEEALEEIGLNLTHNRLRARSNPDNIVDAWDDNHIAAKAEIWNG